VLTTLGLTNFKSWREIAEMRFAPITGLFGANSSGKSSILQVLLMLKQTAESADRTQVLHLGDDRSLVNLGNFREVVYDHAKPTQMRIQLRWRAVEELAVTDPADPNKVLFTGDELGFQTVVSENGGSRMAVDRMAYELDGSSFELARKADGAEGYDLKTDRKGFSFKRVTGRPWDPPGPTKCYGFPDQVRAYYKNAAFLSDLELEFEKFLASIYYLGPLREYPRREYHWSGSEPGDVGRRGERAVEALLASREKGFRLSFGKGKRKLTLEEYVAHWLKQLGMIHSFEVRPISKDSNLFRVWIRRTEDSAEVLITDVGFGISQVLPVLVLCYYVPEGSTIILEQPEIHLHPSVQSGLADVLIDAMRLRKIQVILESHSEHLLKRLQRRIAEGKLAPDETALYFATNAGKESKLECLQMDLFGNISNWPKDFFGDQFGEMAAMTTAMLERKSGGE